MPWVDSPRLGVTFPQDLRRNKHVTCDHRVFKISSELQILGLLMQYYFHQNFLVSPLFFLIPSGSWGVITHSEQKQQLTTTHSKCCIKCTSSPWKQIRNLFRFRRLLGGVVFRVIFVEIDFFWVGIFCGLVFLFDIKVMY